MSCTIHTTLGDLKFELFCEDCPRTCHNFLALCASDYYDHCTFHRNIKGFIVQGGDPSGSGTGGQSIWGCPFEDEFKRTLKHSSRGMLSMANSGANTNKSQFFVTYGKQTSLDMKYTVFGRLIDGHDVLLRMEQVEVDDKYKPLQDILIEGVTIHANPIADSL